MNEPDSKSSVSMELDEGALKNFGVDIGDYEQGDEVELSLTATVDGGKLQVNGMSLVNHGEEDGEGDGEEGSPGMDEMGWDGDGKAIDAILKKRGYA